MKTKTLRKDKVNVITLGCSKNLVDSENLITQLRGNDYDVAHDSDREDANIIVVNTCGFIDLAKQESIDTIVQYANIKQAGGIDKLYVTGCLSQRYKDSLEEAIPEVDAFFGTLEMPALLAKMDADYKYELLGERQITTLPHYAYLENIGRLQPHLFLLRHPADAWQTHQPPRRRTGDGSQKPGPPRRKRTAAHCPGTDLLRPRYL